MIVLAFGLLITTAIYDDPLDEECARHVRLWLADLEVVLFDSKLESSICRRARESICQAAQVEVVSLDPVLA